MMKDTKQDLNKTAVPVFKDSQEIYRVAKDWDIKRYELAKACGVSRGTLNNWDHEEELTPERLRVLNDGITELINQKKKVLMNAFQ